MLSEQRREEIKINLGYAQLGIDKGSVYLYELHKRYLTDVTELLQELDAINGRAEMEKRADEAFELENQRIREETIGRYS